MYNRLINFIQKKNILYDKQFGFRAHYSTDHAILSIIDKIQLAVEERSYSCGIFLDFSKAYDTVNHNILVKKLEQYGIRGIAKEWFASYLSNRQQFVSLNNIKLDLHPVSCGIPQGSVLGPSFFLSYINDFNKCSKLLDFHLFADDSSLFYKHKNLLILQSNINMEFNNIYIWLCANKVSLNIDKSNFVIFHPPQKKLIQDVKLTINRKELTREYSIKYLGFFIDSHLNIPFKYLTIIKLPDLYVLNIAIFTHKFHHKNCHLLLIIILLQLMKFMPTIRDLLPNNPIHCPKSELISESSTLDIRDLKFGILLMSLTKKCLIFN